MKRNIRLEDISDGKLYTANDLVKADCHDCEGCSACCSGMASIVLDPLDVWLLCTGLGKAFEGLMEEHIELQVVDGVIHPRLKMSGDSESCSFLDKNGRCSIHPFRPGICRLFPLGRYYEEAGFRYFLQVNECKKKDQSKIKVKKWLGIPKLKSYEKYIWDWHQFLKTCEEAMKTLDDENQRIFQLYILRTVYQPPYRAGEKSVCERSLESEELYEEVYDRMRDLKERLGL